MLVQIDAAQGGVAVLVDQRDLALEDVDVALGVANRRGWPGDVEDVAQLAQEQILVGPLGRARGGPLGDEGCEVGGHGAAL